MTMKDTAIKIAYKAFGSLLPNDTVSDTTVSVQKITVKLVEYLRQLSAFHNMSEDEIYEQLLVWDPEVGGAIDRMSTMMGQAYSGIVMVDIGEDETEQEKKCLRLAKAYAEALDIGTHIEAWGEVLLTQGNVFLGKTENGYQTLPNRFVSKVNKIEDIGRLGNELIMDANLLVLFESPTPYSNTSKSYKPEEFYHIRYKNTPIFTVDVMRRQTYGLYSLSPVHRTILPVWWKRQIMMVDILNRWRNVPREHHKLSSEAFSIDKYTGTKSEKIASAQAAANAAVSTYKTEIQNQNPDQGYVSLDNTTIEMVQNTSGYADSDRMLGSLSKETWVALNVPESIVNGTGAGSYASELVISNYVSAKVISMATKFKPVLLRLIRDKVKSVDDTLPVEKIDIKFELVLATSMLELFRQAAIMSSIGLFTSAEIRDLVNKAPLTAEQKEEVAQMLVLKSNTRGGKTEADVMRDTASGGGVGTPPETPHSNEQHTSDVGERAGQIP